MTLRRRTAAVIAALGLAGLAGLTGLTASAASAATAPVPAITSISPDEGFSTTQVFIYGTALADDTSGYPGSVTIPVVHFGSELAASVSCDTPLDPATQFTPFCFATAPAPLRPHQVVDITVTNGTLGTSATTPADRFRYVTRSPRVHISSIYPASGPAGSVVTVSGTLSSIFGDPNPWGPGNWFPLTSGIYFGPNPAVIYDCEPRTGHLFPFDAGYNTECGVQVPPGTGRVLVTEHASNGTVSNGKWFTYTG